MKINEKEKMTFIDYCDRDMNLSKTASETFYHRNTIEYRLDSIQRKTGLNPRRFYDAVKLMEMIKNGEL